jgi:prepilin-type N-terminal cleavage/methylation domain-containing protein
VNHNRGFSLVEMAIVLVIAGLLIGTVLTFGTALISNQRILATKDRQSAIKSALITFVIRNNRLPCPAVPTLSESDVGYGNEAATPGTCTSVPNGAGVSIGLVPWKSLGLSSDGADDGYHNRYTYAVTTSQTNLTSSTISGMRGAITVHGSTPVSAVNQLNICTPTGWTYNPCGGVVVLLSHGELGKGAYTASGSRLDLPDAVNVDELENTNIDAAFVDREYNAGQVNSFNDLVMALDPEDLLLPLITSGSIKDYKAQVKKDFAVITGLAASKALANRTNTTPGTRVYTIPPNLTSMNLPGINSLDPWGEAYVYNRVTADIDSTTGNNVAFTITSYGPNSASGGGDDIVETVMVSDMQALFSTYGW